MYNVIYYDNGPFVRPLSYFLCNTSFVGIKKYKGTTNKSEEDNFRRKRSRVVPSDAVTCATLVTMTTQEGPSPPALSDFDDNDVEAITKLQALQRGYIARKEKQEQEEAVSKIAAIQRGRKARKEKKEQEEAVSKIAAIQRGRKG